MARDELTIDYRSAAGNGELVVTARIGDQVVHSDSFDVASDFQRKKYIDDLCDGRPGIDRDALTQHLLRLANERQSTIGDRVPIEVTPDQHIVIAHSIDVLAHDPLIFKRAGKLVHAVREQSDTDDDGIMRSTGTPTIRRVSTGYLGERLSAGCWFFAVDAKGREAQVPPPHFVVSAIHGRGFWEPIRTLTGIVETPVLRPNGSILDTPGWDESTGLLYVPGDEIPEVPPHPDRADAMFAVGMLLELVHDFPFVADVYRSSWLAALLTVLARHAFPGPAPLFLIDANVAGSGKTLSTDVIAIIRTGRSMPRFSNPRDDDEARKRITSLALAGDPVILIDNINSTLGSASLDAALTSTLWKDRRLGVNELVECPLRAVWFATGNNVICVGDTARRVCHVRLESPLESPEERTGFRFPNLLQHVRENRLSLLTAGLTVLRAFVLAGKPDAGLKPWGSFEGWSDLIRNCVVWLGLPDPGETRRELVAQSDTAAAALRSLFCGWHELDPHGTGLTSAEIVGRLDAMPKDCEAARSALRELCDQKDLTAVQVGNKLKHFQGRVIGTQRLEKLPGRSGVKRWRVSSVGVDGGGGGEGGGALSGRFAFDEATTQLTEGK